jgi:hypothetical protein
VHELPGRYCNSNVYSNSHCYGYLYADSNSYSNVNGNCNCDCGAEVYADAQAASDARPMPVSLSFSWLDSGTRGQQLASFLFGWNGVTSTLLAHRGHCRFPVSPKGSESREKV